MSLLEVALAMSIALSGALGLNLAWSQSLPVEQQLILAREARSEALFMLHQWQKSPAEISSTSENARFYSETLGNGAYAWQLEFKGLNGTVRWHGVWSQLSRCQEGTL